MVSMEEWFAFYLKLLGLIQFLLRVQAERQNVCTGYPFKAYCEPGHVLVMERALFGRMEAGRCITSEIGFIGCTNDVLGLTDRWCSGRRGCEFQVPNDDLEKANTECNKNLISYLQATYTCVRVKDLKKKCNPSPPKSLDHKRGLLSSYVTDETDCGSVRAPWRIQGSPGQTVDITLVDFEALDRNLKTSPKCADVYGYVVEESLNINQTICGQNERQSLVYSSKSNTVEINIKRNSGFYFLIKYQLNGCSDIQPPEDAWYKRQHNEATIGCENTGRKWHLKCKNSQWEGNVGNCSQIVVAAASEQEEETIEHLGVVVMTGILGGTVVLAVAIVVFGLMYIHKYKDRKEKVLVTILNKKKEKEQKAEPSTSGKKAPRAQFRPLSTVTTASEGYLQPTPSGVKRHTRTFSAASEGYLQPTINPGYKRSSVMSTSFDTDSVIIGVYETPPGSERQSRNSAFMNRLSLREVALKKNPIYDNTSRCGPSIDSAGGTEMTAIAVFEEEPQSTYTTSGYSSSPCNTGSSRITLKSVAIHKIASMERKRCPSPPPEYTETETETETTALTHPEGDLCSYESLGDAVVIPQKSSLEKRRCPTPPPIGDYMGHDTETTALTSEGGDKRSYESQCDIGNILLRASMDSLDQ